MCNCTSSSSINVCTQCSGGNPCGCPPDYTIPVTPTSCSCCPPGYSFQGANLNWPNGYCLNSAGNQTATIPCSQCSDTLQSDCIILPAISCLGITAGTTLTQFINFLCSESFIQSILTNIGLSSDLSMALCQLTKACPSTNGSTTPVITSITFSTP